MKGKIKSWLREYVAADLQAEIEDLESQLEDARHDPSDEYDPELEEVDSAFITDALASSIDGFKRRTAHQFDGNGAYRYQMDNTYWVPTRESFETMMESDETSQIEYREDRFDCENFAETLRNSMVRTWETNAVGTVISYSGDPPHAFNIVVFADGTAEFLEPQYGQFVDLNDRGWYDMDWAVFTI